MAFTDLGTCWFCSSCMFMVKTNSWTNMLNVCISTSNHGLGMHTDWKPNYLQLVCEDVMDDTMIFDLSVIINARTVTCCSYDGITSVSFFHRKATGTIYSTSCFTLPVLLTDPVSTSSTSLEFDGKEKTFSKAFVDLMSIGLDMRNVSNIFWSPLTNIPR